MGFQDNSGDIILDVVLTDEGRKRLAKADGSFEIVKFACGDDEINYGTRVGKFALDSVPCTNVSYSNRTDLKLEESNITKISTVTNKLLPTHI